MKRRRWRRTCGYGLLFLAACSLELLAAAPGERVAGFFNRKRERHALAGNIVLANDGVPMVDIVLPAGAPPALQFAAGELKRYLDRVAGGEFIIRGEKAARPAIILGNSAMLRQAGHDVSGIARDGYVIRVTQNGILIGGRDDISEIS